MEVVSFALAQKLKEKGFPQHWSDDDYIVENEYDDNFEVGSRYDRCFIPEHLPTISAPTIYQVLKWLREEKKIHIAVDIMRPYPQSQITNWGYNIVLIDKYEVYHFNWNLNSYEESALAGIEYVLDNLI